MRTSVWSLQVWLAIWKVTGKCNNWSRKAHENEKQARETCSAAHELATDVEIIAKTTHQLEDELTQTVQQIALIETELVATASRQTKTEKIVSELQSKYARVQAWYQNLWIAEFDLANLTKFRSLQTFDIAMRLKLTRQSTCMNSEWRSWVEWESSWRRTDNLSKRVIKASARLVLTWLSFCFSSF